MQPPARARRAAADSAALAPPGWPLLELPAPAQRALVASLPVIDRQQLRLACAAAKRLVDEGTANLVLSVQLMTAEQLQAIRPRFPSLAKLALKVWQQEGALPPVMQSMEELIGTADWPAIRQLFLAWLPDAAAALAVHHCPNLTQCQVSIGGNLPTDQALSALARCPSLVDLSFSGGCVEAAGLNALLSMRSLTRLDFQYVVPDNDMPDVAWDFRRMTALHYLNLEHVRGAPLWRPGTEEHEAEQRRHAEQDALTYKSMRLPSSLFDMTLDALPAPKLMLPRLGVLNLPATALTDEGLSHLQAGCPWLRDIRVHALHMTPAAHASPFREVDAVEVTGRFSAAGGVRLATCFPQLRLLELMGDVGIEQPEVFFLGAKELYTFWGCSKQDGKAWAQGTSMSLAMMRPLAALPALQSIGLNLQPAHVEGVQLLEQLTYVKWVVDVNFGLVMLDVLDAACTTYRAPTSLVVAEIQFHDDFSSIHAHRYASAIISWLVQAPSLRRVIWDGQHYCMSAVQLGALSLSTSIQHINIDSECHQQPQYLPQSLLDMARLVASRRNIRVEIQQIAY